MAKVHVVIVNVLLAAQSRKRIEYGIAGVVIGKSAVDALRPVCVFLLLVLL